MISKICGHIRGKKENILLIEIGGICYEVLIPRAIMYSVDNSIKSDGKIELVTYHYFEISKNRNIPVLIGFNNEIEKEFFEKFITVSGIGPKIAVKALSIPFCEIARAIDTGDHNVLNALPGIGRQKAKEIIAKLQSRVGKFGLIKTEHAFGEEKAENIKDETMDVLLQLQYSKKEAEDMINRAFQRNAKLSTCEEILNEVWRQRSK